MLRLADGRAVCVLGLDVLLPNTAHSYGCAVNKSIGPVNNSAFREAQRVNRLVGRKVIVPSHLASGTARAVRAVAQAGPLGRQVRQGGRAGGHGADGY